MKLSFNLENLQDNDNLYYEQFNMINDFMINFRTSKNISIILINLCSCLDVVKKLDEDYMYCKDLFIDNFGYDLVVLKYKLCEIMEYIKKSKIKVDREHAESIHELIGKVFNLINENDKVSFRMNYLEYQAYTDQYEQNYVKALASYKKYIEYMNNNIFLKDKIKQATIEYKDCVKKVKSNKITNNL